MPDRSADNPWLAALRDSPLSIDEVVAAVQDAACGAVVVFLGTVRNHDQGAGVQGLDYSAHPSAEAELAAVCQEVTERTPGARVGAVHRVGELAVGDLAVIVAAAAAHRAEAFTAAKDLIDTLKSRVPIWKHQSFTDGSTQWVGLP